jgi:hypothetical protein
MALDLELQDLGQLGFDRARQDQVAAQRLGGVEGEHDPVVGGIDSRQHRL